jgi:hypothetical protein
VAAVQLCSAGAADGGARGTGSSRSWWAGHVCASASESEFKKSGCTVDGVG